MQDALREMGVTEDEVLRERKHNFGVNMNWNEKFVNNFTLENTHTYITKSAKSS